MSAPIDLDEIAAEHRYAPHGRWSWRRKPEKTPELTAKQMANDLIRDMRDMPEPESEVMPIEEPGANGSPRTENDTRPPSATGADRINPLDDIALKLGNLTYGEMIDLSDALWQVAKTFDQPVTLGALPAILHKWAVGHGKE